MTTRTSPLDDLKLSKEQLTTYGTLGGLLVVLVAAYWNTLTRLSENWSSPQYSHGWLVPAFALVLLWLRREPLKPVADWERWAGVGLLALGLTMRLLSTAIALVIPDMVSFVPCVAGIVLLVGGLHMLIWAGPAILFLLFMYPLPDRVEQALLNPLQLAATRVSTFALQTMGVAAYADGTRIQLSNVQLGVIDQCSGLRMLTIFVALSVAVTMVTTRPWWERIVIIVSAVPIALAVNVTRITVTGLLYLVNEDLAERVFHDFAGYVMMPLALGMLYVELQILDHLFIEEEGEEAMPMDFAPGSPARV
mgnify:CR=1 FL=1